VKKKLKQDKGC